MTKHRTAFGVALGVLSILAVAVVARSTAQVPRAVATLVIVAGPGLAWVPVLQLRDRALEALLCLLFSVTAVILIAQAVTYSAGFSWRPCEFALVATTVTGLLAQALAALVDGGAGRR